MTRTPNRWSPETLERAHETRAWMDARAADGHAVGDDEVWGFVTTRWSAIPTGTAELVLNVAMSLPPAGRTTLLAALTDAFRGMCDGTYSDDPAVWTLELGPHGAMTVPDLIERLAEEMAPRLQGGAPDMVAPASPSGPGR